MPVTYGEVSFLEPESYAEQNRLTGIVTTDSCGGYYVDIFRSRCKEGDDKMHDYFYHNLGQGLTLTASDGSDLDLQPTEELAFAGAHLYAYSYIYDKKMAETNRDVKATFTVKMQNGDDISMNLWMKGEAGRKVFSALSPATEGYSRTPNMPYRIGESPTLTFVARQSGEAWNAPFVAIYEPASVSEPSTIRSVTFPCVESDGAGSHVGIKVEHTDGGTDRILSSDNKGHLCRMEGVTAKARYALCRTKGNEESLLFMGNGTLLSARRITIKSESPAQVLLRRNDNGWECCSSSPCTVTMGKKTFHFPATDDKFVPLNLAVQLRASANGCVTY